MEILYILVGILLGVIVGFLVAKNKFQNNQNHSVEIATLQTKLDSSIHQIQEKQSELVQAASRHQELLEKEKQHIAEIQELKTKYDNIVSIQESKQKEFEKNQEQLKVQFEILANKILEEKSKTFAEQNRSNLDIILNPLKEKISNFEEKVEKTYQTEARERHSLQSEIKNLMELNTKLNDEASKLTKALKGDTKKQGNWGEIILEKILESSGLSKDKEYFTQYSTSNEENERLFPDVVIHLPENKHLVIDSKVSLVGYEKLVNAENNEERKSAIDEHLLSVRNHVKNLSGKDYTKAYGINSPDFVLMFMPIESSFGAAIEADAELFNFAWNNKIVIVSPSTLLATLKTVASIWRQEKQNANAAEIAKQAGDLYDKFDGLVNDLKKLGNQLDTAQKTYSDTFNKLKSGKGNLVNRVEKLKLMGAKASKSLDPKLLEDSETE